MKFLIIDHLHPILATGLRDLGHEVTEHPNISPEQLPQALQNMDGLIVRSKLYIDRTIIDLGPQLKVIVRAGAGMDNVDESYAQSKGIICIHAAGANADAVGEHAIGMLLMLFNRLNIANEEVKNGIWNREGNRGIELKGKTIGIIGYGHTGSALARKLSGFDVRILAYDKYIKGYENSYVNESTLDEIFDKADIISFHVPLTYETQWMCNHEFIHRFKKPIYILNLSRGKVAKTIDIADAIAEGRILGAALDVLENEKINQLTSADKTWFEYLSQHPKVVLSPHVGGWTDESYERISAFLLEKIQRLRV